jgi:hypothetical protein
MPPPVASAASRAATIRAGRLVAVAGVLVVVALVVCWQFAFKPDTQHLVLFFEDDVSGLYTGSPVKTNGVTVGQVEAIGLRISAAPHVSCHAEVRIALENRKMAALGIPRDLSARSNLDSEISNGLRGKLVLLSATTGEYGVELTYDRYVLPVCIAEPAEGLAEIPVIPNMLSGEKLATLADAITVFGQSDFPRLVREWDESLDSALAATDPGHVQLPVRDLSARLENTKNLFADTRIRDDLRNINERLVRLRETLEQSKGNSLLRAVSFYEDMARLRESLASAGEWLARLSAQLDADTPELQAVFGTLEALREFSGNLEREVKK